MVPLAFGAWASFGSERPRDLAAVRVELTPVPATIVTDPVPISSLVAAYQPEPPERRLQSAPHQATARRAIVAASPTMAATKAAPQKVAWEPPRRHVPRPLSPGEFGRR
jgi:hypothetical protein